MTTRASCTQRIDMNDDKSDDDDTNYDINDDDDKNHEADNVDEEVVEKADDNACDCDETVRRVIEDDDDCISNGGYPW